MIAIVVTHDSVAMEIALTQQIFGRRIPELAAVTGDGDSHYDVVLCGEQDEHTLGHGTNPAGSLRSRRSPLPTR
ncbi:hypothetical protein [Pseudonocardia sp. GCM10023141]|uniref:hypothetical protein n=1 Tax=Pseudonocardia sp. GCM10023141 TaxID=3252653 RepID=UPI00361B0109